jgi:hypothetical protein
VRLLPVDDELDVFGEACGDFFDDVAFEQFGLGKTRRGSTFTSRFDISRRNDIAWMNRPTSVYGCPENLKRNSSARLSSA